MEISNLLFIRRIDLRGVMILGNLKVPIVTKGKDYYFPNEECIIEKVFINYHFRQLWCKVRIISKINTRTNIIITALEDIIR